MLALILWLCFAVACTLVARNKNRSEVLWFIAGALLGIFALLFLLLLPSLPSNNKN